MGNNSKEGSGGTDNGNPTQNDNQYFTDDEWDSVSTPEEIAELTGWEFTKTKRGSYQFYDAEHDLTLFIDKTMLSNGFINAKSDGKNNVKVNGNEYGTPEAKDLRDIVRYVHELPEDNKNATPAIIFQNHFKTSNLGLHRTTYNTLTGESVEGHVVVINSSSFRSNVGHSIRRTLLHETDHAIDFMKGTDTRHGDDHLFGISSKQSFRDAINSDVLKNGFKGVSQNSGQYKKGSERYYRECWADAASVVQMKELGYGNERIKLHNGVVVSVNDWIKMHPNTYEATRRELSSSDISNYGKSSDYNYLSDYNKKEFKIDV